MTLKTMTRTSAIDQIAGHVKIFIWICTNLGYEKKIDETHNDGGCYATTHTNEGDDRTQACRETSPNGIEHQAIYNGVPPLETAPRPTKIED